MKNSFFTLYLEINHLNFIFFVLESDEYGNFKIVYKFELPLKGMDNNRITDLNEVARVIKENIYIIEQKLNYTFKEIVLILENFDTTSVNFSGFKKLNRSQILNENITYILNNLKSCVQDTETKKTILHIFNSKFCLDNKKTENLPIGLFGDHYSHELSFILINSNDYLNLNNIFAKCNLKIKKILTKSFIKGVNTSENFSNTETFFQIQVNKDSSTIIYFENNSLKSIQDFRFGTNIIVKDISKVTGLKIEIVKNILEAIEFKEGMYEDELIEKEFFNKDEYRKIKKKLIYEIALARIKEILELLIINNINFKYYIKATKVIFLEIDQELNIKSLKDICKIVFSINGNFKVNFLNETSFSNFSKTVNKLVHFGWKKEAIPITQFKKSIIARFFDAIFG